jgi:hypothetical protein
MRPTASAAITIGCGLLFSLPGLSLGQAAPRSPVLTTPHFAFYSDFDTNVNDALIAAGVARKNSKPELFHAGAEGPCFEKLAPSTRAAWDGAVDYYAKIVSPVGFGARQQFLVRRQLVGFDSGGGNAAASEYIDIVRSFRAAAAPAYRACHWAAQDANNRRWIAELKPRLAADEEKTATRIQELYRKRWATLPILVDIVETVDWSGANTAWSDSGQGDLLIASSPGGAAAFEILFHESSHILMDRGDPIRQALEGAAKAADVKLPNDLWHVVLFYTTGEAVRRILDERGPTAYNPMLYEIFARGSWGEYRQALETNWLPYVEGKRSLDDAATRLIAAIGKPQVR